jgi:hypothetical protein
VDGRVCEAVVFLEDRVIYVEAWEPAFKHRSSRRGFYRSDGIEFALHSGVVVESTARTCPMQQPELAWRGNGGRFTTVIDHCKTRPRGRGGTYSVEEP